MTVDTGARLRYGTRPLHQKPAAHKNLVDGNGASPEPTAHEVRTFDGLFRTYHARLREFARAYVACPAVAEELVHDVFLRMWERRSVLQDCIAPKGYLYTAVRNQALKHLAHEAVVWRTHAMVTEEGRVPGTGEGPVRADEQLEAGELAAAFEGALDRLPARCREAFTLYRDERMSYAEIGEVMGISERTVETQLARANKVLRRELAEWVK
ncbi:MAG: RNA polymerase sigma-70 factor [Vicinamibacterales bacterium]